MEHLIDEETKNRLIADFKVVIADAEALLRATANHGGEELAQVRAKAEASLAVVRDQLTVAQAALVQRTRQAAKATEVYLHENPWTSIGVAAGFGLLIGLLSGRR